ncbi:MAG: ABC transporter permease [Anaerolineales bacterium]|nr:ABC transporter permease [Anaerolineales bacterium]
MLWDVAWKSLWRRKLRSLMAVLGVASAVQLYLMVHGVMGTYTSGIENQVNAFAGKILVQQEVESSGGSVDPTSAASSLTDAAAAELLAVEGIDRRVSSALLFIPIARSIMPYTPPAVVAVGIEPGHEEAYLTGLEAEAGRLTLGGPEEVILGRSAAEYYRSASGGRSVAVGDSVDVGGRAFTVVGLLGDAPQLFANAVVMPLETAQALFDRRGTVSAVILTARTAEETGDVKSAILDRFSGLSVSTQDDMLRNAEALLQAMRGFMRIIETSILAVAVVLVTIVIVVSVMELRREIGTLRAVGARRWRILAMVAGQSVVLSLLGTSAALPIAIFLVRWGMEEYLSNFSGLFAVWGQTVLIAVSVGLAASLLPAWQAVRVDPLESLRYE